MQNKIQKLPQELINQIAAGEVVERPASIVKELVENSIDAGAKNITIELENGGINLVKITDDGSGMSQDDAKLSITQHATSKIVTVDDLFNIGTMGFRGEALASISSVCSFSLVTKREDDLSGFEIKVIDNVETFSSVGCPSGTSITVKNLFSNVPARKKYLKTAVTEYNHIVDLFINYALVHSQISWKLNHNGRTVYQYSQATDHRSRIHEVLGKEIAENLLEVNYDQGDYSLKGFVGKPQIARNNRKLQYLFVNDRPVNEYVVAKRVKDAFTTLIPNNMFPVYILFLTANNKEVDVNVHPRKLEVRFADPQKVYQLIYRAVGDVLDSNELVKSVSFSDNKAFPETREPSSYSNQGQPSKMLSTPMKFSGGQNNSFAYQPRKTSIDPNNPSEAPELFARNYNILGQVQNSYIIVENENGLKIYDQHATSERIQYEKIKEQWITNKLIKQQLLLPENIELSPSEANSIRNNLSFFEKLGYELSEFSGNTFIINAVPQLVASKKYQEGLRAIIGELGEQEISVNLEENEVPEVVNRVLNSMSCRSAVMFGDQLSMEQMYALIDDLVKGENRYTCVHGRPCVIAYDFADLERLFKRRN